MLTIVASMAVFALIGAITPGPVNIIATSTGATFGFPRTIPYTLGAAGAYTLIVLLMGLSLGQLIQAMPQLTSTLTYIGSLFLLYMAYKIAFSAPDDLRGNTQQTTPPGLIQGALCQWLSPKAWLYAMSGTSIFILPQHEPIHLINFCLISLSACAVSTSTWAAAGQMIRRLLHTPRQQTLFNYLMGLLLGLMVLSMLFSRS